MTQKVLVSACLLGMRVRYDGERLDRSFDILRRWLAEGRVVGVCPEVAGGLGVPRPPAEIRHGDGDDVLDGSAHVVTEDGADVTAAFLTGAEAALRLAREHGVRVAVLKERSPSCGPRQLYDGTFSDELVDGTGVTATLLRRHGVEVFGESELADADRRLRQIAGGGGK